ncbi:hypothetical protein BC833DRAFT_612725 [Globomyces pollinis-pini]|nr:hypothetical protein BC833DRAFT_612725 [Globomyces pollinis-pini]
MAISILEAVTITGGSCFSGMNLTLTFQVLKSFGLELNLKNDPSRQTVLALILLVASICTVISYPLNQTGQVVQLANFLSLTVFVCVQYGLVIINHNTLSRLGATRNNSSLLKKLSKFWPLLYFIPIFTLIPIYMAAIETIPLGLPLNRSKYNVFYFKPLNIALVMLTEVWAVMTDIKLLIQVGDSLSRNPKAINSNSFSMNWKKVRLYNTNKLWFNYIIIWMLLCFDIIIKLMISLGIHLLFDSSITICTLAMRAKCNLKYGEWIKHILYTPKVINHSQLSSGMEPTERSNLYSVSVPSPIYDVDRSNGIKFV